jgi:Methyltransferase domain
MHLGVTSRTLKGFRRFPAFWSAPSELDRMVATHTGYRMNKWKHYSEIYDRHLSRFRGGNITVLEIGVAGGGSLEIWRRYFGPNARIVGIDINPDCKTFEAPGTHVAIGDQGDPEFLKRVAEEFGPFDILIDDGSHAHKHQLATFRTLFPHIRDDGVYACEDLCSSYWKEEFGGGVGQPGTFIEFLKGLIDEINAWFWRENVETEERAFAHSAHGLHFYPTLVVIEKRAMKKPIIMPVGRTRDIARPSIRS